MSSNKEDRQAHAKLEEPLIAANVEEVPAIALPDTIEVIAPATLPEGYTFEAEVGGNVFLVTVPTGGVEEGQSIIVPTKVSTATPMSQVPTGAGAHSDSNNSTGAHHIPNGAWRDGLFDCFVHGCCHAQLCLSCFCAPLALGQVMERMHLSWSGGDTGSTSVSGTCGTVAIIFIIYIFTLSVIESIEDGLSHPNHGNVPPAYYIFYFLHMMLRLAFLIYMVMAIAKTRRYIREKHSIREKYCHGMEDCCCAYWCPCLTIAQMARHTADYDTYNARCCTSTGLPPNAPAIV